MPNQTQDSQITNLMTELMYIRQFRSLAQNVYQIKNLPSFIDSGYINQILENLGAIAFFYDDVLNTILALPFDSISSIDVYGRPTRISVYGLNGYRRNLYRDEFVIMYDNNMKIPIDRMVCEYAKRYAIYTRTIDINIWQQRTPRFWQVPKEQEVTFKRIMNEVNSGKVEVMTYDNLQVDGISAVLQPAPYVSTQIEEQRKALKAEFLEFIGISNIQYVKKERVITDEMVQSQGNTIASRFNRYEPRKRAVEQINEKFKEYLDKPLEVGYYDGIPSTGLKEKNEEVKEDV